MRSEKELLLNEIKEKIDASTSFFVTRYEKLEPNASWALRDALSKQGSVFEVVRKRIFLKAAEKAGLQIDSSGLDGHIGVVFINQGDAMAPAKSVFKFSQENADTLRVLFGQIEGKIVPGAEVEILSKLPGLEEMRAILLGLFVSPMSLTLSVMEAAVEKMSSNPEQ
jgi:large subunit ribosomal protein L10